jgi:hypothetical protein
MAMLSEAKLTYVGSATIAENRVDLCIPKDLQPMIGGAPDVAMRELLCDYVANKHFRRDVYIKGSVALSPQEKRDRLSDIRFVLIGSLENVPQSFSVPAGTATPNQDRLKAILERLSAGPAVGADLVAAGKSVGGEMGGVYRLLEILVHNNVVYPARPDFEQLDHEPAQRVNRATLSLAARGNTHHYLASPVLGSAVPCGYVDRLVAAALLQDGTDQGDGQLAEQLVQILSAAGLKLERDGQPVTDDVKEMGKHTEEFRSQRLPRWHALGLIPGTL